MSRVKKILFGWKQREAEDNVQWPWKGLPSTRKGEGLGKAL